MKDKQHVDVSAIVLAPVNEGLPPQQRLESSLRLSDLMTKMATHVICHVIVDYEELLAEERFSVASAFLERVTSTHLCNHKLTKEGIVLRYKGEAFQLHEEYKTMTLTRSVYEHLVMFYFLFSHPKTDEERSVVWNYWKINSKKNLMETSSPTPQQPHSPTPSPSPEGREVGAVKASPSGGGGWGPIEVLRKEIFSTRLGMECYQKLDEWTAPDKPTQNGAIAFFRKRADNGQSSMVNGQSSMVNGQPSMVNGQCYDVRRVSYNQAWRYLFGKGQEDMDQLYRHLSIHSHPIYDGLMQYQDQAQKDEGFDGVPLYLSSCFLAYLCRLFLRLLPQGERMFDGEFSEDEIQVFKALSRITALP